MKFGEIPPSGLGGDVVKGELFTDDRWITKAQLKPDSSELIRQLRRQGLPKPSVLLCLMQFRGYQNDSACIQNVKKTALAIFCFSPFDTNWKMSNSLTFP